MLICPRCSHTNDTKAERCSGCSEPFDHSAPTNLAENPEQLIGRIVNGKYEVLSILGEGGMGVVYKVRHLILQNKNTFALKILHPKLCAQPDFHARFLREVEIAMELTHENIIQIRDFGMTEQNLLFYTMDFFAGESLKRIIEVESPLPPRRVVGIVRQILLALAEAHKAGIIHRDLKPDNLLIERINDHTDRVRILDFGIAKILVGDGETDEKHANITQGGVLGTPKYMSPEQASGERIDGRSDLYALGCIAYEMLTGSVPFTGNTTRAILVAHLTSPPLPFKEVKPGLEVPAHVESLVFRLLEKDREKRPATAEAVLEILTGRPTAPAAPPSPARRPARTVMLGAALAAVLALASAGFFLSPFPHGEARRAEAAGRGPSSIDVEAPAAAPRGLSRKLRCAICGATYARGEKVGDMCHGEPLVEAGG
jgi:serine/threonine-protein kinase